MPVSETTIQSKANDYRSWLKLGLAGLAIVIVLAIILLVFALSRANTGVTANQIAPANSLAAINVTNPESATDVLNTRLTDTVKNLDSTDPNAAVSSILNSLLGNSDNASSARIGLTYDVVSTEGTIKVDFVGNVVKGTDNAASLEGKATIVANTTQTPNLTVPVDLVLLNQRLYIKVNQPTGNLPDDYAMLALLEGKFLKIDLQSLTSLSASSSTTAQDVLDSQKRTDLINTWTTNPPFINPVNAPDRVVGGVTLQCMKVTMNPEAFKDSKNASDYPPTEICSHNGNAPVYFGVNMDTDKEKVTVGITIFTFGENVTIIEPSEDVVDLSGLLGGLK